MRYIHAVRGFGLAIIPITLAAIFAPEFPKISGLEVVLTVSTFIFAILAGFYLSRTNTRYDSMREVVSAEDALWLSFYHAAGFYGAAFKKKLQKQIDTYYITSLNLKDDLGTHYKPTMDQYAEIYDSLIKLNVKPNNKRENIIDDMVVALMSLEEKRNLSSVIARERMKIGQWMILIILATMIFITLFLLKTDEWFSVVSMILLSGSLVLILLVIRDLDRFRLGGRMLLYESAQEVFEGIGKPRYYLQEHIDEHLVSIPKNLKHYRIGNYHSEGKLKIKTIKK